MCGESWALDGTFDQSACRLPLGFENRDERERREGESFVNPAKDGRECVEREDLAEAESSSPKDFAVQPLGRPTGSVEKDHLAYAEPGLLGELLERLRCVAAAMTECLVKRALDLRTMRNQDHRPPLSRDNLPDVRQRRPIVIHVLDDIEADHRIEPARNLGERPSSRHPRR